MLSTALVTKLFASPALIGLASVAGKRWGPGLSGLLGGLPLVAAPIVLALWLSEGPETAHRVAVTAPIGVWATMTYLLVYGFASARFRWQFSLALGWVAYLTVASALHFSGLDRQPSLGFAVIPVLLFAATRLLPRALAEPLPVELPHHELAARMLAAVALVSLLTGVATLIGPEFTGVFAGAPVAATVIPSFTFAMAGRDPLLRALRGFLSGQMGFAAFFIVFAAVMPTIGALAWLPATITGVAVSAFGARWVRLHAHRTGVMH